EMQSRGDLDQAAQQVLRFRRGRAPNLFPCVVSGVKIAVAEALQTFGQEPLSVLLGKLGMKRRGHALPGYSVSRFCADLKLSARPRGGGRACPARASREAR